MASSDTEAVRRVLVEAGVVPAEDDLAALAASYATMRALAATLHRPDLADEEPILTFDPTRR